MTQGAERLVLESQARAKKQHIDMVVGSLPQRDPADKRPHISVNTTCTQVPPFSSSPRTAFSSSKSSLSSKTWSSSTTTELSPFLKHKTALSPFAPVKKDVSNPLLLRLKQAFNSVTPFPFLLCWQFGLFIAAWGYSRFSGNYSLMSATVGEGLHIARGAAMSLNFSCAAILLFMCKWWLTKLRIVSPKLMDRMFLDQHAAVHRWLGYSIVVLTVIHVLAHLYNYAYVSHV